MPKGMINIYICQKCGNQIVTKDVDEGTTPFMLSCKREGCDGMMYSQWYRVPQDLEPDYEFFMPESTAGYPPEMVEHIELGGLDMRKVGGNGDELELV